MKTIQVTTGFGYFTDAAGHIRAKAELPPGVHPMDPDYTYTQVTDAAALAAVEVWQDPADVDRQTNEAKITAWIADWLRTLAMQDLKNKGELPAGYE